MVSDLCPILSLVRSFAKHALIADDTRSEIVYWDCVWLAAHNFWRHIAGCSGGVFPVVRIPYTRDAKICDPKVAHFVEDEILGFDIAM